VLAGFAAMAVLVMAGSMVWMMLRVPGGMKAMRERMRPGDAPALPAPPPAYLAFNLTLSFFAALLGGWVTAGLAPNAPGGHRITLGAVILVMALASSRTPASAGQPGWYRIVIPVVGLAGVGLSALIG